jgi:hypothetical protein
MLILGFIDGSRLGDVGGFGLGIAVELGHWAKRIRY